MDYTLLAIRTKRHELGYTLQKLGDALGVTPQAVSAWERGISKPPYEFLLQVFNTNENLHEWSRAMLAYYHPIIYETLRRNHTEIPGIYVTK